MQRIAFIPLLLFVLAACKSGKGDFDASGVFEADEVIVSAEVGGKIMAFNVDEGDTVQAGQITVVIDSTSLLLQQQQVDASISALQEKTMDVHPQLQLLQEQLQVQQAQLEALLNEERRFENLVKADAATRKQLDDIRTQREVLQKQMQVTRQQMKVQETLTGTQNRSILSEAQPLAKRRMQLRDQLERTQVRNPINGIVLTKYAEAGEVTAPGKALYKVGDLQQMKLRAYISGSQLSQIKTGQKVKVLIDDGAKAYKTLEGTISWISSQAEFTPKTIQTKEERANLVYAVKIDVPNDGYLKIGMYGEVKFQ